VKGPEDDSVVFGFVRGRRDEEGYGTGDNGEEGQQPGSLTATKNR